jgi:hypothetical protein
LLEVTSSTTLQFLVRFKREEHSVSVDIAIHLIGLPEVELADYDLTPEGIRECAADLSQRLGAVADTVERLQSDGWAVQIIRNSREARHPQVSTHSEAVERLRRLHIDEDTVTDIAEWNDRGERLTPP